MLYYPGLDVLVESLGPSKRTLTCISRGLAPLQAETFYSFLLGQPVDERVKTLNELIQIRPSDRAAFIARVFSQVVYDQMLGIYNKNQFGIDLAHAISDVNTSYTRQYNKKTRRANEATPKTIKKKFVNRFVSLDSLDVTLLLLDIDYFKYVNDRYGHPEGDKVLREVVDHSKEVLREDDVRRFYRVGGEEFAALLPYTSPDIGMNIAERLRGAVESKMSGRFADRGITVTIGVANYKQTTSDANALYQQADHALYRAKEQGRNRVVLYR